MSNILNTTIDIDCAPFTPRPSEYFEYICRNILKCEYYEPISKFFGNWTWEVTYNSEESRAQVKKYLTGLYHDGLIRYASW